MHGILYVCRRRKEQWSLILPERLSKGVSMSKFNEGKPHLGWCSRWSTKQPRDIPVSSAYLNFKKRLEVKWCETRRATEIPSRIVLVLKRSKKRVCQIVKWRILKIFKVLFIISARSDEKRRESVDWKLKKKETNPSNLHRHLTGCHLQHAWQIKISCTFLCSFS